MSNFKNNPTKLLDLNASAEFIDDLILMDEKTTLFEVVKQFKDDGILYTYISNILNDGSKLMELLSRSYKHQNGFHKIVLEVGKFYKLRLHVFKEISDLKKPMENIHNHRWNFASLVYRGKLTMEMIGIADEKSGGELFFDHDYRPALEKGAKYGANLVGVTQLKVIERRNIEEGSCYYMAKEELHRILSDQSQDVVTLVMTGQPQNENCRLYSTKLFKEEQKSIIRYTKNELISLLEGIAIL